MKVSRIIRLYLSISIFLIGFKHKQASRAKHVVIENFLYKGQNLAEQYTYDQFMAKGLLVSNRRSSLEDRTIDSAFYSGGSVKETNLCQCFSTLHVDYQSPFHTVQ